MQCIYFGRSSAIDCHDYVNRMGRGVLKVNLGRCDLVLQMRAYNKLIIVHTCICVLSENF